MWHQDKSVDGKIQPSPQPSKQSSNQPSTQPSTQYVLCSPGLSHIFDKFNTNDDMDSFDLESLKSSPTPLKLKSILKKTPSKSQKIICSPSSAAIRRTKSEICRRSLSARRELRFGPDTKKSPSILGLSPEKQSTTFRFKKLFRRNSISTVNHKVNRFATSTPINFLDDSDEDDHMQSKNWRASIRNNLPLFYGAEKFQCAHCKRTWENNSDLLLHLNGHHKGVRHWLRPQYRCGICASKFYNNKYLLRHCHLQHTPTTKRGMR